MRKTLLLSAVLIGFAATAMAQSGIASPEAAANPNGKPPSSAGPAPLARHVRKPVRRARPAPAPAQSGDIRPGHEPGVGESYPLSGNASNITPGDTRSTIAPTLPRPTGGENVPVRQLLAEAQKALSANQTGLAQEALERAETAMLQRSVPVDQANAPDQAPDVQHVSSALGSLANRDVAGAKLHVDAAMKSGQ